MFTQTLTQTLHNHILTTLAVRFHSPFLSVTQTSRGYQLRRINRRLPLRTIHTAPSGQLTWFDVQEISFDETSFDESTGQWGVFWCAGVQHLSNAQTLRRMLPSYTLSAE